MNNSDKYSDLFRKEYQERCKTEHSLYSIGGTPREDMNFVFSQVKTMAAFIHGKQLTSVFAVLDFEFNMLLMRSFKAYVWSCGISPDGKYAILNTAATRPVNDDSQKLIFFDVDKKRMLFRIRMTIKEALKITSYSLDTDEKIISIHYKDGSTNRYDFKGNKLSLK